MNNPNHKKYLLVWHRLGDRRRECQNEEYDELAQVVTRRNILRNLGYVHQDSITLYKQVEVLE
jgi:hypothetical protein